MNTVNKTNQKTGFQVRTLAQIGMLAAIGTILMFFEVPLPFAPSFYEIDFSEVPVMVGTFAMGPWAGAAIELVKILLKVVLKGTMTLGVGDLANFLVGCALCIPAGLIYRRNHTRKGAMIGMITGTAMMTILGCFLNAFILLPSYAKLFEMPMEALIEMGSAVNSSITGLTSFIILAVAPFNLLKGTIVSLLVFLIYKKLRPILKASN